MKAVSLRQPWATLVAIGAKRVVTWPWSTTFRGPLAIHASEKFSDEDRQWALSTPACFAALARAGFDKRGFDLPLGSVVATGLLMECVRITDHLQTVEIAGAGDYRIPPDEPERTFGHYEAGRFAWILVNVRALPSPIPASGALRLWEWPTGL